MSTDLDRFLKFLYHTDTGYVYSPIKMETGEWIQKFFQWPSQQQELKDWILTSSEEGNVYIAPALFERKSSMKDSFQHTNVCWVEFDGQKAPDFKGLPEPDMIVQSSGDAHFHCYWKTEKVSRAEVAEDVNRRLTYHLMADGSGWDINQVLRPPLTKNWKYKEKPPVSLKKCEPPLFKHKLFEFDHAPEVKNAPIVLLAEELDSVDSIMERRSFPSELKVRVTKQITTEPRTRSTFLMRSAYLFATAGCTEQEIIALLYEIDKRLEKFTGRADQMLRLAEIASIAVFDSTKHLYIEGYSPSEILSNEQTLEWIIPGWLHRNGIMMVSGAPGVGKTQLCFDLAYRLSTGDSFLEREPCEPMPVAFLSLEMEIVELKYILEHQTAAWKETGSYDLFNANFRAYAPDDERSFSAYERILANNKPRVLIIDSLSELADDDLKESEARIIMGWVRKMRKEYDCAIILIHHNRKASDGNKKPRKLSDLYGSYVFGKLSETVISMWDLEKDDKLEIDSFKVRFGTKAPLTVQRSEHLTFKKVEGVKINVGRRSGEIGNSNPLLAILKESDSG